MKCCICEKPITDYGNNPQPIKKEGRFCDICNMTIVIPSRMKYLHDYEG